MWSSCKTRATLVLSLTKNGKCQQILFRIPKNKIYENPLHRVIAKHSKRQCHSQDITSHTNLMCWSYETALLSNYDAVNMLVKRSKLHQSSIKLRERCRLVYWRLAGQQVRIRFQATERNFFRQPHQPIFPENSVSRVHVA